MTDIKALQKWNKIDKIHQKELLNNVFCSPCGNTTIVDYDIKDEDMGVILEGNCKTCRQKIFRVVESAWFEEVSNEDEPNFADYEKQVKRIHEKNMELLTVFEMWLVEKGLTKKTINKHVGNVDFYINEYLSYYEPTEVSEGIYMISGFLGDWFVRKAMWSTPAQVKANATSIKKFYGFLLEETDIINKVDYDELCATIKVQMPEWLEHDWFNDDYMDSDW